MSLAMHNDNSLAKENRDRFLSRRSVIEMRARERGAGSYRRKCYDGDHAERQPACDDGYSVNHAFR